MKKSLFKKASAAATSAATLLSCVLYSAPVVTAADDLLRFEFEDAEITGEVTVEKDSNASGGSALKMTNSGTITMNITVDESGPYRLTFYAFGIGTDKQQNLTVNGSSQGAIGIPMGDGYQAVELTAIPVKSGNNTIVIEKSWGWSQFEYLTAEAMSDAKAEAKQVTILPYEALITATSAVLSMAVMTAQQTVS